VEVDAILCNHAEAVENKLYLAGGGINMCLVGPEPPHVVTLGLGVIVHVPYQATEQPHRLLIVLIDEDGVPVVPFHPPEMGKPNPIRLEVPFTMGRPPMVDVGDDQVLAVAANLPNLPLANIGLFSFVLEIDGTELRRLPFRVLLPPSGSAGAAT
jgi:hypothetical protein